MKYRNKSIRLIIIILITISTVLPALSCSEKKSKILKYGTGINIAIERLEDTNTIFRFKEPGALNVGKDLFNYLYFEGDTLGFYVLVSGDIKIKKAEAVIINPINNSSFHAERIDIKNNKVFGFTLLGTIMENFYREKINLPVPRDRFCCSYIDYAVDIIISGETENINMRINGKFRIEYSRKN